MTRSENAATIRFDAFELDLQTRELRKDGRPIKLQDQPGKLLVLLASRAGKLVTRAEIEKALWREGEFVEFEHAVNTAVRKIREALSEEMARDATVCVLGEDVALGGPFGVTKGLADLYGETRVVNTPISEGTVICIIEAMKVMNEIKAEISGTVVEICAENGKPVQFGQALFRLK